VLAVSIACTLLSMPRATLNSTPSAKATPLRSVNLRHGVCAGWPLTVVRGGKKKKALIEMQREQQRLLVEKSREDERHRRAETEAKRKILQRAQGRQVCERAMCWCDRI
jgi:hypothetical protein